MTPTTPTPPAEESHPQPETDATCVPTLGQQLDELLTKKEPEDKRINAVQVKLREKAAELVTKGTQEIFLLLPNADTSSCKYLDAVQNFFVKESKNESIASRIVRILMKAGIGKEVPMDSFRGIIQDHTNFQYVQKKLREHTLFDIQGTNPEEAAGCPAVPSDPYRIGVNTISITLCVRTSRKSLSATEAEQFARVQNDPDLVRRVLQFLETDTPQDHGSDAS